MKNVSLADAKSNIAELFDAVERGETVQISPDKAVADHGPLDAERIERGRQAMRELLEMRKQNGRATLEEILEWRDEGRK